MQDFHVCPSGAEYALSSTRFLARVPIFDSLVYRQGFIRVADDDICVPNMCLSEVLQIKRHLPRLDSQRSSHMSLQMLFCRQTADPSDELSRPVYAWSIRPVTPRIKAQRLLEVIIQVIIFLPHLQTLVFPKARQQRVDDCVLQSRAMRQ